MTQDLRRENAWFSICYKPHWYKIVKKMRWRVRGGGVMLSILYMTHKRIQAETFSQFSICLKEQLFWNWGWILYTVYILGGGVREGRGQKYLKQLTA